MVWQDLEHHSRMKHLLVFGGTFDPVHWGHIRVAQTVQAHWHFDQFLFLPCKIPVLKTPAQASAQHRANMLQIMLKDQPASFYFSLDCREIERPEPSYMLTTLRELRQTHGKALPITILIGYDSFCELPKWHRWRDLLSLANILVIQRDAFQSDQLSDTLNTYLQTHLVYTPDALLTTSHGCIMMFDAGNYDISSTHIRNCLLIQQNCDDKVPKVVMDYIVKHQLYRY